MLWAIIPRPDRFDPPGPKVAREEEPDLFWTPEALPGDEPTLRRDGHELRVFSELSAVAAGDTTLEQWRERCRALGIADVRLARGLPVYT